MNRAKKLTAWILAFALCCSAAIVLAQDSDPVERYAEAVETLVALDILEGYDDDLQLGAAVTRAEMVTMLNRAMGLQAEGSTTTPFADVSDSHWAASDIGLGVSAGLIKGYDEKTFAPDDPVTYEQAVKMLVCALGFSPQAEYGGGYPTGYLSVAVQKGVLKNTDGFVGQIIRRGALAQLIFNALDTDMVIRTGYDGGEETGEIVPGRTMLTEYLNIRKGSGVVKATALTGLTGASALADGQVQIENDVFLAGDTGVETHLGYYVTYYAAISDGIDPEELIYVRRNDAKNNTLVIEAEQLLTEDPDFSALRIVYEKPSGNAGYISLSPYADMIYNGAAAGSFTADDLKIDEGRITLLDNNGDGAYELILVESYENIVLSMVSSASGMAYDLYDQTKMVRVDAIDSGDSITIMRDGMPINVDGLVKYNILSVAQSGSKTGKKRIMITVSGDTVSGTVSELTDGGDKLVIAGKEYKVARNIKERLKQKVYSGFAAKFYLDAFGKIAAFEEDAESAAGFLYGYLMDAREKRIIDATLSLKILTESDGVQVFETADHVTVDGSPVEVVADIRALLEENKREESLPQLDQLIRYKANTTGKIYEIDTLTRGANEDDDSLTMDAGDRNTQRRYMSTASALGTLLPDFLVEDGMTIFLLPSKKNIGNDKKYSVAGFSYLKHSMYLNCEAYDLDEHLSARVLLAYGKDTEEIEKMADFAIVKNVTADALNADGEIVPKLTALYLGQETELYAPEDQKELLLGEDGRTPRYKCGDIIRIEVNGAEVTAIESVLSPEDNPCIRGFGYDAEQWYFSTVRVHYGYGTACDGDYLTIQTRSGSAEVSEPFKLNGKTSYTLYEQKKNRIMTTDRSEVEDYLLERNPNAKICVITAAGTPTAVIIMDLSK